MGQHRKATELIDCDQLCSNNCGELAKFLSPRGKYLCKPTASQCPMVKLKASTALKAAHEKAGGSYFCYDSLSPEIKAKMNHNKGKTADTDAAIAKQAESRRTSFNNGNWKGGQYGVAVDSTLRWKRNKFDYNDSFGNHCVLESWNELIVANELDKNGIKWVRPTRFLLSSGKFYEPDFYLTDFNVYLDPKANFFGKKAYQGYEPYVDQLEKIKAFEVDHLAICIVLWAHEKNSFHWDEIYRRVAERVYAVDLKSTG